MYNEKKYNHDYYIKHKKELKKYHAIWHKKTWKKRRKNNLPKIRLYNKKRYHTDKKYRIKKILQGIIWYKQHKEKILQQRKLYHNKNRVKILKYQKIYAQHNRKKLNLYRKNKIKKDINYKLSCLIRNRINQALKRNVKKGHSIDLLGCTIQELRRHLEKHFKKGMSWKNYGKWHIDHIKPCCIFELNKTTDQYKCFNYINLQPLWAKENYAKRKYDNLLLTNRKKNVKLII